MIDKEITLFLEILQIALGNREQFDKAPTEEEWRGLLAEAKRQAVVGVTFHAIERLPENQLPPRRVKLQWYGLTENIRNANRQMVAKIATVAARLSDDGFDSLLLKGAGTAVLYPDPTVRTSGDIDIWAWAKETGKGLKGTDSLENRRKVLTAYARTMDPKCDVCYHHTTLPAIGGTEIELHFTPTWMNAPRANRRLQKRFDPCRTKQQGMVFSPTLQVNIPSHTFNVCYSMVHICRHLFSEGIGMRQIVDYYYILQAREHGNMAAEEACKHLMHELSRIGLKHFTAAVMWVLKEGLGMPDEYLLCKPDERRGRLLLHEIMLAGNFGHDDPRVEGMNEAPLPARAVRKTRRNLRYFSLCPAEAFWSPIFKMWQLLHKKKWNRVHQIPVSD
jgi:hypothetical protein